MSRSRKRLGSSVLPCQRARHSLEDHPRVVRSAASAHHATEAEFAGLETVSKADQMRTRSMPLSSMGVAETFRQTRSHGRRTLAKLGKLARLTGTFVHWQACGCLRAASAANAGIRPHAVRKPQSRQWRLRRSRRPSESQLGCRALVPAERIPAEELVVPSIPRSCSDWGGSGQWRVIEKSGKDRTSCGHRHRLSRTIASHVRAPSGSR